MSLFRAKGVILRTTKLGEADRIVHVATDSRGKVRAVVKGVRKTKSRWGARLEPLSHVSIMCWEGRDLDVVTQAEVIDSFRVIREDLDRFVKAAVLLESVDRLSQDGDDDGNHYRMLVGALRSLSQENAPALVGAFLWKLLAVEGATPVVDRCVNCSVVGPLVAFEPLQGGALCRDCRQGRPISQEALDLMACMLGGRLASALRQTNDHVAAEVENFATQAMETHLERRLRSLGVLDRA